MLKENELVAGLSLNSCSDGVVSLDNIAAKYVVLYFYPKDDTPGCTLEAQDFSRLKDGFDKQDTVVFGVSKDDIKSHNKFKAKHNLTIDLLEDDQSISEKFGIFVEKSMYGKKYFGIERTTYLLGPIALKEGSESKQGRKVIKIWNKVKVDNHAQEVLDYIGSL